MIALMRPIYVGCNCTSSYCNCQTYSSNRPDIVVVYDAPKAEVGGLKLPPNLLKTWLIWVGLRRKWAVRFVRVIDLLAAPVLWPPLRLVPARARAKRYKLQSPRHARKRT